jgi:hypothetical protein
MSDQLPTENDLRRALRSVAPESIDATYFREHLDRVLVGQLPAAPQLPADDGEATLLLLDLPGPQSRSRTKRIELGMAVAIAACAAVLVAVFFSVVSAGSSEHRPPSPALNAAVPASIRSMLLPGTIVLHTYEGQGSQAFDVVARPVPPHFSYSAYGTCAGVGTLGIAQQTIIGVCDHGGGGFGTSGAVENGRLVITADKTTRWQVTLALAPDLQTNGSIQNPVDQDMSGPNNGVRRSGQGSSTVSFTGETPTSPARTIYRLRLLCHGSGVTLPNLTTPGIDGLQTKTCFAGHEYVWIDIPLTRPIRIHVEASPETTWTIAIDSM